MDNTHPIPPQTLRLQPWPRCNCTKCSPAYPPSAGSHETNFEENHWSHPTVAKNLLDRYIGSCFLWLSPILFPYKSTLVKLQVVQTTLMIESLRLYIPDTSDQEAHQLQRIRRHVVREWLSRATHTQSWPTQCLRRFWSFLGHICRQDFGSQHPARTMLEHLARKHTSGLTRPGPWHTVHSLMRKFWTETQLEHD